MKSGKLLSLEFTKYTLQYLIILLYFFTFTLFLNTAIADSHQQGGTFLFGRGGDSVGLDPALEEDGESFKVCDNIYDTLIHYKDGSTEIEPGLATKWESSEDGLSWTFSLRKGVTFHDGTPFNAEAVLFSLNRQHDKNHPYHNVEGSYTYWVATGLAEIVDEIVSIDDFTVKITLNSPYAPFLNAIAITPFSIVSPTAVKEKGNNYSNHPVGTGPFIFQQWDRGDKIVLKANENYWGGRPNLDRVIFLSIPDNSVRLIELQQGNLHAMEFPNPDDLEQIRDDDSLELLSQPGMSVGYLALNMEKPPFDNHNVRLAINHAINKSVIIEHLYQGLGIPAKNPIPPTLWSYDDSIEDYEHNPKLAKELLTKAGYPNGFETTLWALPVPRPYIPDGRALAEVLQSELREIGIKANIVTYDWGTYLEKTKYGEHDMAMLGWSADFGDPDNFLYFLLSKSSAEKPAGNISFYKSDEMQQILEKARNISDNDQRIALYKKAQNLFHQDIPWVPLAHAQQVLVINKRVEHLQLHPLNWKYFKNITLGK
ncbi:ABC transporter substrate-binding protein [Candidatus Poribacteria bacterium]|nr:ABC transporter substrate-binding protein [Candidatus Poribacteria bacterium]